MVRTLSNTIRYEKVIRPVEIRETIQYEAIVRVSKLVPVDVEEHVHLGVHRYKEQARRACADYVYNMIKYSTRGPGPYVAVKEKPNG